MALFQKSNQNEELIGGILDAQENAMVVLRGKDCNILFQNTAAKALLPSDLQYAPSCQDSYCKHFPALCKNCPLDDTGLSLPFTSEVADLEKKPFSATFNKLVWLDGKPAIVLYLRSLEAEREANEKLYRLAYVDQLTGVFNRQRFKEDFEAKAEGIASGKLCGAVTIFDLDNFKAINDTYGHNTGDIMLRRLTDYLKNEANYAGHLYRLGGDEFVLFYVEEAGRFKTEEEARLHYTELFQPAFLSYTMPNIDLSCTISMGISFFPAHGTSSSELLRKADIALYKAKASGRNQMVIFEDRYDAAKKFKDLYINIQPILTEHGRTYGYELVDRGNDNLADGSELNLSEFDRSLDALGLGEIDSDARYFITFNNQLLGKSVPSYLLKDKFIIEVHLPERIDDSQIDKYRQLRVAGFALALTDFDGTNASKAMLGLAEFIKFSDDVDGYMQKQLIGQLSAKRFVATKVDTQADFEAAKRRGYNLFQGFFFNQPVVVKKTKDIDPMKVNYLRLLKLTSTDDYVDFHEISSVISSDVALSYKLLRLLNSAAVGLRNKISSIDMALAYLGEEHLKKWIALLAIRGIASDKPLELVRISLIRARFGELLAVHFTPRLNETHVFMTGMFSLLHIALEKTKEELFDEIPVAEEIRSSILTSDGPYSGLVAFFSSYEYANWDEVSRFAAEHDLGDTTISEAYISAVKWYSELSED